MQNSHGKKKTSTSSHSLAARIVALACAVLIVASAFLFLLFQTMK